MFRLLTIPKLGLFKKRNNLISTVILSFVLVLLLGSPSLSYPVKGTEILWDSYGIPHIYGKDVRSAFYSFGWAQMHSHGNLLLRLYGQARGKAAAYWGEKYLESDKWVLTMGIPSRASSWYQLQSPSIRADVDAFVEGINAYAQQHPELIDDEVKAVLPVKGEDVLAHVHRVLHFTFVVNPREIAGISKQELKPGSNAWAIAPARSASGHAMLLANPHTLWSDLFLWYEAQITAPGIEGYGATLVGVPVLAIAFNHNLGWTYTVNTHDGWDVYKLKLAKDGYLFDGRVLPFQTQNLTLQVKQPDGTIKTQPLVVKSSIHGAVISQTENTALALRVVGLDQPHVLAQWWEMIRAQNLPQFEKALQRLQLPMFTIMYADRDGHIMHLFNGQVPVRGSGDFAYWDSVVPGDTSKTLWTKTHPYQDLPKVIDPPTGWLQNANDPPWTTTFPPAIKAEDYPAYIAPKFMDFRPQRSAKMLLEDTKISLAEMIAYKHSTRMELSDRILDDLIPAVRKYGNQLAQQAANVLEKWDRQANANSQGAVLFTAWADKLDFDQAFSQPWNENQPLTTPDGLANPKQAVELLEQAATEVQKTYNNLDISWGEVFRLRSGKIDLPANGAEGYLGTFRVVNFTPAEAGRFQAFSGDSFVAAIEFSQPVKAMVLNSYGNSTQPNSPHFGDQLQLFANQKLRPVWLTKKEIINHLENRETF
ncbi:MAG TPA: acylase [Nostocaceae cyanobacterium]|nr:acylase [Nostocaceae cyanobacterium]